jgi:hypothetical protein
VSRDERRVPHSRQQLQRDAKAPSAGDRIVRRRPRASSGFE